MVGELNVVSRYPADSAGFSITIDEVAAGYCVTETPYVELMASILPWYGMIQLIHDEPFE
jgi:hypothetical protein